MDVLELAARLPDALNFLWRAVKYWRVTASVLMASFFIFVVCFYWEGMAIRLIAGFHLLVLFTTAGVIWQTGRK
jgi:hypothetical protein